MFAGLVAVLIAGAVPPTIRDCSELMKSISDLEIDSSLQQAFEKISDSHLFVWIPAAFMGKPPQIFSKEVGAKSFSVSPIGTRRFVAQLARSKNAQLRKMYRQMLPRRTFLAWQEGERNIDRNFSHDFYIVKREARSFRVVFHLRLFEAMFDRSSAVPLPAEVLEKSLDGDSQGKVLALARAFRQLSVMSKDHHRAQRESFIELGQYLVNAEPEQAYLLKQMAASLLIQLFFNDRRDRLFVFVPASPVHERLYSRDFGLRTRQDNWGHWVKGRDLVAGLQGFLKRNHLRVHISRRNR